MKKITRKVFIIMLSAVMVLGITQGALAAVGKVSPPRGASQPAKVQGTVEQTTVNGTEVYIYVAKDWVRDQNSAMPLLMVYGDKAFDEASVRKYAGDNDLDELLADYKGNAIFMNPADGKSWADEDIDNYAAVAGNINHKSDTPIVKAEDKDDVYAGFYGRLYIAAEGSGADFINTMLLPAFAEGRLSGTDTVGNGDALPASLMLFDAKEAPVDAGLTAMPAALYGCSDEVVEYYTALNNEELNPCYKTCVMPDGADFAEGFREMSSMLRFYVNNEGDDPSTPAQYRYYQIPDYEALGITEEKLGALGKAGDYDLDVYAWMDKDIDLTKKHPLVVGFHGGGNSATFFAWTTKWPERAQKNDLVFAAVQNHDKLGGEEAADAFWDIIGQLVEKYNVDESRIYLTGFSQGSANTFNTAGKYADKLAGILPMDGLTGFEDAGKAEMPIYFAVGSEDALVRIPDGTVPGGGSIKDILADVYKFAGLEYSYDENAENRFEKNDLWGITFDAENQFAVKDANTEFCNLVTQGFVNDENGDPRIGFQFTDDMVHCTMALQSDLGWNFIRQFSRNADGSIAYKPARTRARLKDLDVIGSVTGDSLIEYKAGTTQYDITVQSDTYGLLVKPEVTKGTDVEVTVRNTPAAYGGTDKTEPEAAAWNEKYEGYVIPLSQTYESYLAENAYTQTAYITVSDKTGLGKTYVLNIARESDDELIKKWERGVYTYTSTEEKFLEQAVELGVAEEKPGQIEIELPYYLYVPEGAKAGDDLPVVFALHGAGQRPPQDAEMLLRRYRMGLELAEYTDCIVLMPQCNTPLVDGRPAYDWGLPDQLEEGRLVPSVYLEGAYALLQEVKEEYADIIDTGRIYCTGMSMGGMGTLALGLKYPEEWAALMPAVGFKVGADDDFSALKDVPFMLGVSEADSTYENYPDLTERLNKAGIKWDERFYDEETFLWTTPHFAWIPFYGDDEVLEWLFAQKK